MWPADSDIEQHKLHLPIWLEQMKAAGFEVEADPQPFATWLDNYTNLKYDASLSLNQVYEYAGVQPGLPALGRPGAQQHLRDRRRQALPGDRRGRSTR